MDNKCASIFFEALSSPIRLDIFRLLVRNAPDGLVAGDIAETLKIQPTNLSFHLKALTQSGLLEVEREGRYMRYRAKIPLMLDIIAYLTAECCAEHPEKCLAFREASAVPRGALPELWLD